MARRVLALILLGLALMVCVALAASESLTNRTGRTATAVSVTFSEQVRITSYDETVFPTKDPSSRSDTFRFGGGQLENGARFSVSWTPSTAEITNTEWDTASPFPGPTSEGILDDHFIVAARLSGQTLIKRTWDSHWRRTQPLTLLKEAGFEWACVSVRTESSAYLRETSPTAWGELPWRDEYWDSLEMAEQLLREAQAAGFKLWLYLHLSDQATWATHQHAPKEWQGMSVDDTATRLQEYTFQTARYFAERGIHIDMYSMSGEIEYGILDFTTKDTDPAGRLAGSSSTAALLQRNVWPTEAKLLDAGIAGLRRANPDALVLLYVACQQLLFPEEAEVEGLTAAFFKTMFLEGVDFDIAGISWPYPYAEGAWPFPARSEEWLFSEATEICEEIARLGKHVIIAEAGYPSSSFGVSGQPMPAFPFTPAGQAAWLKRMLEYSYSSPYLHGFTYFFPEYIPVDYDPPSQWAMHSNSLFNADEATKPALQVLREFLQEHR